MSLAEVRWIELPHAVDARGVLTAVEAEQTIPFSIRRVFYMHGTPAGVDRGGHAHRDTRQVAIAVCGRFRMELSDGADTRSFQMHDPNRGLYMPAMTWVRLVDFSAGAVCLVLADTLYERARSIRDWAQFLAHAQRTPAGA